LTIDLSGSIRSAIFLTTSEFIYGNVYLFSIFTSSLSLLLSAVLFLLAFYTISIDFVSELSRYSVKILTRTQCTLTAFCLLSTRFKMSEFNAEDWKLKARAVVKLGTGTFRAQDLSFPRTNSPYGELVPDTFRSESSLELSFPGPFVLGNFRSRGTKVPGNFRSQDFSFPGTFVLPTILQRIGYERRQL